MRKLLLIASFAVLCVVANPLHAQRYLTEVFTSNTVTANNVYASNITVITGAPTLDTLYYDVYEPAGDTMAERPVVIVSHTGSFLPSPQNGQATGSRTDSAVVTICNKLAARGFVAVAMSNRFGWNPLGTQDERTGTLLNAAYRGIQDARTLVRHLRDNYSNGGNTYAINPNQVIMGGMGTGGYISLGCGYLDSYDEINLAKFLDVGTGISYVDTSLSGDVEGKWNRPLNIGNYVNESSEVQFVFNMGGAVGDSSWIEAGEPPVASVACPNDPFAPYAFGAVIVPTTGDFVVNVSGSQGVQERAQRLGINSSFDANIYVDPTSLQAATVNGGLNGLMPFNRPTPESAPWEQWNQAIWDAVPHPSGGTFHTVGLMTNPDMSAAKSNNYIDSTLNFIVPRIVCSLSLGNCAAATNATSTVETLDVSFFPNPSTNFLNIAAGNANAIESVVVTDLSGRQVKAINGLNVTAFELDHTGMANGMYFITVQTRKGAVTQKLLFN